MYKVVIVDDEPIIVEGLSKTVPWQKWGCTVVGTAEDGAEGIKVIAKCRPDMVITDICMSGMDGLEMIAALRSEYPEMEVAILTGFRDFDYAQKAIGLGVTRFLLKPSRLDEIEEAVVSMVGNIEEKRRKKRLMESYYSISESELLAEPGKPAGKPAGQSVGRTEIAAESFTGQRLGDFTENGLENGLKGAETEPVSFTERAGEASGNCLDAAAVWPADCPSSGELGYSEAAPGVIPPGMAVSQPGITSPDMAVSQPGVTSPGMAVSQPGVISPGMAVSQPGVISSGMAVSQPGVMPPDMAGEENAAGGQPEAAEPEIVAGSFVVNNAIKFIEANYMDKIKLNDVAEHVYVSQWHLSKLLNRHAGQSFSGVLNQIRIEKAKELLKDPSLRIGDVADMVGFLDMAHFSRVFKKQTGISAHVYRNGRI